MRTGRRVLVFVFGLFASTLLAENVSAQTYPTKPITLIAPWAAGGAIDALCRAIGPKLAERLGQRGMDLFLGEALEPGEIQTVVAGRGDRPKGADLRP